MSQYMSELLDCHIYIVDDEPHNLVLLTKMLNRRGFRRITTRQQPTSLMDEMLQAQPDLLLLDMTMPQLSGLEVLEQLQPLIAGHPPLPVLVLTGDTRTDTRRAALNLGAKDFVNKPFDPPEVLCRIENLLESRLLHREVEGRIRRFATYRDEALECLTRLSCMLEPERAEALASSTRLLAGSAGLEEELCDRLSRAAPLCGLADRDVQSVGPILDGATCPVLALAGCLVRYQHERWDGTGYPRGLAAEEIPVEARIFTICDAFEGLTSGRARRDPAFALAELAAQSGRRFDPQLLSLFCEAVGGHTLEPAIAEGG